MLTVHVARLYPNAAVAAELDRWLNASRRVWNHYLEHRIKAYKRRGESITSYDQSAMLTQWRRNDPRLAAVPRAALRDAVDRLDLAFSGFFRRLKAGKKPGFPRFKGRGRWRSVEIREASDYVRGNRIRIPKIGLVRARNVRSVGVAKSLVIVKRADRWYAHLLFDDGRPVPDKVPVASAVGIDVGVASFATFSTGEKIQNPRVFFSLKRKLAKASRRVSRRTSKVSARRRSAILRRARVYQKIADTRRHFASVLSKRVVAEFDLIAVEKLDLAALGRGRFSRNISDASWGVFLRQLSYKAERAGKTLIEVEARGTSQECHRCGQNVPKPIEVRVHRCPSCGLVMDRDENAARNILLRALPAVGGEVTHGEIPAWGSLNREEQLSLLATQ